MSWHLQVLRSQPDIHIEYSRITRGENEPDTPPVLKSWVVVTSASLKHPVSLGEDANNPEGPTLPKVILTAIGPGSDSTASIVMSDDVASRVGRDLIRAARMQ